MISIIIPVFNAEAYIKQCLNSILEQTFSEIEVICINDGSTDNSGSILEEYRRCDSRVKVVEQPNQGVSAARNRGIEESIGEWILFVDADDWLELHTCETTLHAASEYGSDLVFWSYTREYENGTSQPKYLLNKNTVFEAETLRVLQVRMVGLIGTELSHPELCDSYGTVWGKLYKSAIIKDNRIKFVDLKRIGSNEDGLFNFIYFQHIAKAVYIHQVLTHYRKFNTTSITSRYNPDLVEQWRYLYRLMAQYITDHSLNNNYTQALNNRIALGIIGLGLNLSFSTKNVWQKRAELRSIICSADYRNALDLLTLTYFPIHWKLFFLAAQKRASTLLLLLLMAIKKLK